MARRKGPLIALLLLAGLAAGVWLDQRGTVARRKAKADADRAIAFERSDLSGLHLRNAHGSVTLRKTGDTWRVVEPVATAADRDAVEGLLSSLESARVERRLDEGSAAGDYGLEQPGVTLTLELGSPEKSATLEVGDESAIGGSYYARLPGDGRLAMVGSSVDQVTRSDLFQLRDKTLLAFDSWKVTGLRIDRGRDTVRLSKPADGWKLEEPVEAPADGPLIADLLSAIERLRAQSFVSENPTDADLRRAGLHPPAARVTIRLEGTETGKAIDFGASSDGQRHARREGEGPVVLVPGDIWTKITTRLFDLRRKEILSINRYRIESITVSRHGKPALVLTRLKEAEPERSWQVSGLASGTIGHDPVDSFLGTVSDLKALSFEDRPPEALRSSLSRRPAIDLTLQEEAGGEGGAPRSQHLVFGAPDRSGVALVRDMAWRPIARVGGSSIARLESRIDALAAEAAKPPAPEATPAAPEAVPPASGAAAGDTMPHDGS